MRHDPNRLQRLRAEIAALRRVMEKRLLKVRSIEPTFSIGRRAKVRVAVVEFGEKVNAKVLLGYGNAVQISSSILGTIWQYYAKARL